MCNQNLLQSIVSQIREAINLFAYRRLTDKAYIDPEATIQAMRECGDETLGDFALRSLFQ